MSFSDEMLYAAFRAAFVVTLDCMLRESLDQQHTAARASGFLDVYPVLRGTAPQIQLECLLGTWDHVYRGENQLSRLDACVMDAACDTLARTGEQESRTTLASVWRGPLTLKTAPDHWVTSKIRVLQLAMDESHADELAQLGHALNDRGTSPHELRPLETSAPMDDLLTIVGRWTASKVILLESRGLLTEAEEDILRIFFEEQPGLLR